ncbi:hypothetical protein HON36_02350 [Candidatus Parcubacteria bacterium]|jgi:hypothetical protein|nr:hypothetical protein [Candidatus Parcubacteria bacterium]MBT7228072.1 hypothetical protein [Candidatus Parcubacteria bacterium]
MPKKQCAELKDSFENDLDLEWRVYLKNIDEMLESGQSKSPGFMAMIQKQIVEKIDKLQKKTKSARSYTVSGQIIKYEIKHTDPLEGGQYSNTEKAILSIRKSRKFETDVIRVGDNLTAGDGIIVRAGDENIVGTDEKPIIYTVIGFESGTNVVVASYEASVMLGLKKKTKNVLIKEAEILKMLDN